MAEDAPAPLPAVGAAAAAAAAGAGVEVLCDFKASIHLRKVPVIVCWSSRAVLEVKVSVWLPA